MGGLPTTAAAPAAAAPATPRPSTTTTTNKIDTSSLKTPGNNNLDALKVPLLESSQPAAANNINPVASSDGQQQSDSVKKWTRPPKIVTRCFCNGDIYCGPIEPATGCPGGGNGIIFYRDGSIYVGYLRDGKRTCQGTFIHALTEVQYDGQWQDDLWHGQGCLYSSLDGTILTGTWASGEIVGEGIRTDLFSGLTWAETYKDGRLKSYRLIKITPAGGDETPSSQTSSNESEREEQRLGKAPVAAVRGKAAAANRTPKVKSEDESRAMLRMKTNWRRQSNVCARAEGSALSRLPACSCGSPHLINYARKPEHLEQPVAPSEKPPAPPPPSGGGITITSAHFRVLDERRVSLESDGSSMSEALIGLSGGRRHTVMSEIGSRSSSASYRNREVAQWTSQDVQKWLLSEKMPSLVRERFAAADISGPQMAGLTRQALRDQVGILAFGQRVKLMTAIRNLIASSSRQSAQPTGLPQISAPPLEISVPNKTNSSTQRLLTGFQPKSSFLLNSAPGSRLASARSTLNQELTHDNNPPTNNQNPACEGIPINEPPEGSQKINKGVVRLAIDSKDEVEPEKRPVPRFNVASLRLASKQSLGAMENASSLLSTRRERTRRVPANFEIPFAQLEFMDLISDDGANSSTFRGRWLGKVVAIKVFTGYLVHREIWENYVQFISMLRHPNIVLILGVASKPPLIHCIVTEYINNGSLASYLHGEDFSLALEFATAKHNQTSSSWAPNVWFNFGKKRSKCSRNCKCTSKNAEVECGSRMPLKTATMKPDRSSIDEEAAVLGTGLPGSDLTCTHLDSYLPILFPMAADPRDKTKMLIAPRDRKGARRGDPLALQAIIFIARGIILGGIYLRQKGLSNFNLKPTNVLLDDSFNSKLTDFGEHVLLDVFVTSPLFASVQNGPTPHIQCPRCGAHFDGEQLIVVDPTISRPRRLNWLPPEVLRIPHQVFPSTPAADSYAFGLILWEMVTQAVPFAGLSQTQVRGAVGFGSFQPNLDSLPHVIKVLIEECIAFAPNARLCSLEELLWRLTRFYHSANSFATETLTQFMRGIA